MRKILILGLVAASLVGATPARSETVAESVLVPVYANVAIPRTLYVLSGEPTNGIFGYVFSLQNKRGTFTLSAASGEPDFVEFDIFFYEKLTDSDPTGYFFECPDGVIFCSKHGSIPARSNFAVVTMAVGLSSGFKYVS